MTLNTQALRITNHERIHCEDCGQFMTQKEITTQELRDEVNVRSGNYIFKPTEAKNTPSSEKTQRIAGASPYSFKYGRPNGRSKRVNGFCASAFNRLAVWTARIRKAFGSLISKQTSEALAVSLMTGLAMYSVFFAYQVTQ